jgi:hypothetical protein
MPLGDRTERPGHRGGARWLYAGWLAAFALSGTATAAGPEKAHERTFTARQAQALADDVGAAVERIRGLKFKRPVAVKIVSDAEARKHFTERLDKFWPAADVKLEQQAYRQLGLLPAGTDVVASLLDLLEEQAGGYYDPETQTFFLLDDMPRAAAPVLMAHELTHALDDQHFGLDPRLAAAAKDDDRGTALGAVVEGSGTLVMSAYMVREMEAGRLSRRSLLEMAESEAGRAKKLKAAPALLERMLMAPYMLGPSFLCRGDSSRLASGILSPRDIDHAIQEPPVSTEQILHPEKYWDRDRRDEPRVVTLPDLSATLGEGWKLSLTAGLGELTIAVLTGAGSVDPNSRDATLPSSWTNAAAAGWGGDRLHLYQSEKGTATVLATVWDSARDAQEFEAALSNAPPKVTLRRGDAVVVVVADAGVELKALATAALDAIAPPAKEK